MEVAKWKLEIQVTADLIRKYSKDFSKHDKARKHSTYKKLRLEELEKSWKQFEELHSNITTALGSPDTSLENLKTEIEIIYTTYSDQLLLIPDDAKNETDDKEKMNESHETLQNFLSTQQVRFDGIERILQQLQHMMDTRQMITISWCKIKTQALSGYWDRVSTGHEEMAMFNLPTEYIERKLAMEQAYEEALITLQDGMSNNHQATNVKSDIKLPRAEIPEFHGDYFEWANFRDLFVALVKENTNISNVQRMQLLKTATKGEAKGLISDLTLSNNNFDIAWDRLVHRYENQKVMVQLFLKKLITQSHIKADNADSQQIKQILDKTDQILEALRNLGRPVASWDDWIIMTISHKLNESLRREWEKRVGKLTSLPSWSDLKEFLEEEYRIAEGVEKSKKKIHQKQHQTQTPEKIKSNQASIVQAPCPNCKKQHSLFDCGGFKKMSIEDRWSLARKEKLCFRCLTIHEDRSCKKTCKRCQKPHSTWLHGESNKQIKSNVAQTSDQPILEVSSNIAMITENINNNSLMINSVHSNKQVLLATASIKVMNYLGKMIKLRAVIDFGSQGCMITTDATMILNLTPYNNNTRIVPIGGGSSIKTKITTITIKPRFESDFEMTVDCYCMNKLMRAVPDADFDIIQWPHLKDLKWADPKFNKVGPVDVLLGVDVIDQLMLSGIKKGSVGEPVAQNTNLGWIVSGRLSNDKNEKKGIQSLAANTQEFDLDLQRFWELEDLVPQRELTQDEVECNELFEKGYSRDVHGIFTVKIPFKKGDLGPDQLGYSKQQALARFKTLELKLSRDLKLKEEYTRIMNEYITLNHMHMVDERNPKRYYIPHHAVFKEDSLTTKVRVVFDASAKTSSGKSLNDCMFTGAKQQDDLFIILMRWRKGKIVFKADIEKMYRQINISEHDQSYHTILWRNDKTEPMKEFQMSKVTFGTAAAPYLATRTLRQIGLDGQEKYPIGAQKIMNDFYVDDLISGEDSLEQALLAKNEIITLLNRGGMKLRKWVSNNDHFLETIPQDETERSLQEFSDSDSKTLGLRWNPRKDAFNFKVSWISNDQQLTKRRLLSQASKLFDPSGWLAPVIVTAKLIMKEVWVTVIKWDDEVPENVMKQWISYQNELLQLEQIEIPRWIRWNSAGTISLHGFCDGSEKAYSAVVYTRIKSMESISITLIAAKTKVTPKKAKLTTPKIELCGAVLLKNLITKVKEALQYEDMKEYAWSDSMITLGWVNCDPGRWKSFVANRVAQIQNKSTSGWNYVKSEDNPADCASRGILPSELKDHPLWWTGPKWLSEDENTWPSKKIEEHDLEQRREKKVNLTILEPDIIERFSSWMRLSRVVARILRWKNKNKGPLLAEELNQAKTLILKQHQLQTFGKEYCRLNKNKPIKNNSSILNLNPVLGKDGLLRVGGRIDQADLPFEIKHPVILAGSHHLTKLIIESVHEDTAHGGPQLMNTLLRKTYWIVRGKRAINNVFKSCVICKRQAGKTCTQLMGELPLSRLKGTRPFLHTGVDYTGIVEIRSSRLRKAPIQVGYIALFVCFSTKAIHLELVSDQSTNAFLAALQRFTARRGLCSDISSDNGTNFVGAKNKLEQDLFQIRNQEMANYAANKGINWHFIPVNSPHQGGLWERNIGCMKTHLKRVLGNTRLTFEEYGTVLCQIEACLNSRPLCPLTEDPEDLNVLTPGHFLIGDALLAIPQPSLADTTRNLIHRWKHLQLLQQHFWKRWSLEYLTQLQQRMKWKNEQTNLKPGDIVLIKHDNLPPRKWDMGRIVETNPGLDGKVRVVSIKTMKGIEKRAITKICPLLKEEPPLEETLEQVNKDLPTPKTRKPETQAYNLNNRTLRPRPLKSMLWLAIIGLLLMITGGIGNTISKESPVNITKFKIHPGIYFENLGHAGVITTNWHIYLSIELSQYQYEIKLLQDSIHNLKKLCHNQSHCSEISDRLTKDINEIKRANKLLNHNGSTRTKRHAPLGFIGWLEHEAFGVMDEENADHIELQFEKVNKNEDHLLALIRNQTNAADVTLNVMKNTQKEINENYQKIGEMISNIQNETNETEESNNMLGLAIYLSLMTQNIERFQSNMINFLADLNQGHINPQLFTPDQLLTQLTLINNNLPPGNKIPEIPKDDLRSFYHLLRGSSRVTSKRIIFDLILPLISTDEYEIQKIIPVPTRHGNHRISVRPESEFLMITLEKDKFYQMEKDEYNSCLMLTTMKKICKLQQPSYNAQSSRSRCERDLLDQRTTLSGNCRFEITNEENVWIHLQSQNKWIYGIGDKLTLNVICNNEALSVTIEGAGIIQIKPGCKIIQPEMTITAETHKLSKDKLNFSPNMNLSSAMVKGKWPVLNLTIDHSLQLQQIHKQLENIHDQTFVEKIQHYSHFGAQTAVWLIFTIIAVILWMKRHQLRKLCSLLSTYMITSSGHLIESSWQNRRLELPTTQPRTQSVPALNTRWQDVQVGHKTGGI